MIGELVIELVAAKRHDAGRLGERTLRLAGHQTLDAVDDRTQAVRSSGRQVERRFRSLRDLELVEPVVQDRAVLRIKHQALHCGQTQVFLRIFDAGQQPSRARQAARHFTLELHRNGHDLASRAFRELADVLDFVRVDRVVVHQTRHVEVAHLALLGRTLRAFGAALTESDELQRTGTLFDRHRSGADRVGIEDVQATQRTRLVRVALHPLRQGQCAEGVAVEDVDDFASHGLFLFGKRKAALLAAY